MFSYKVIFLSFFLFFSCLEKDKALELEVFLHRIFLTATAYQINPKLSIIDDVVKGPEGVLANLMVVGTTSEDYCLNYKFPRDLDAGTLFVVKKQKLNCEDELFSKPLFQYEGIYNLGVKMPKTFELTLIVDDKEMSFTLMNLSQKLHPKLFDSSTDVSLVKGATLSWDFLKNERFLGDKEICFEVDDECRVIRPDRCGLCEHGSYYIKNSKCLGAYSKVCGVDRCGEKGEYACIRGHQASGVGKDYCFNDSPVGFCKGKLRVACYNKALVCE